MKKSSNTSRVVQTIGLIFLLFFCTSSFIYLKSNLRQIQTEKLTVEKTPLYLPEAKYVKLITMGFDNFFSDILWFNTINYFGKQYRSGQDYQWLSHMCTITSELDPKAFYLYEFCATTLSWMAKAPEESVEILTRGINTLPSYWRLRFLRGFNYWYFLDQPEKAADDFKIAATFDEAPKFLAGLASRLVNKSAGPGSAIMFLDEMIKNAHDGAEKAALIEKRKLAEVSLAKMKLSQAASNYEKQTGKKITDLNELFTSKILKGNLKDPFGGQYYLDKNTGKIETTSGIQGLEFRGKSISTGLASKEWNKVETDEPRD